MTALYDRLAELPLRLEDVAFERREQAVSSDFVRVTTTIVLSGGGHAGRGEDVTYDAAAHDDFPIAIDEGASTLGELSERLEPFGLTDYRRWGFESAALDLALRQSDLSLGRAVGRPSRPVRFVVSTRQDIGPWLEQNPELEFKVDPTSDWGDERMRATAATGRVRVVDLKGQYEGTSVDQAPDPQLYEAVARTFPDAVIEDPKLTPETRAALAGTEDRWSWDAPIHSAQDIAERAPRFCNIKPSRFGPIHRLLEAIAYCEANGITMYGGGQFELGRGREQIQVLASLFYADAANDVAPSEYNEGGPRSGLPKSPLQVSEALGF